jgi:hypothetical protein
MATQSFSDLAFNRSAKSSNPFFNNPEIVTSLSQQIISGSAGLTYPPDLGNSNYYFTMDFAKYDRPDVFSQATFNTEFSISLPIPSNLKEGFGVNYEERNLGAIIGQAADLLTPSAKAAITGGGIAGIKSAAEGVSSGNEGKIFGGGFGAAADDLARKSGQIGSDIADVTEQTIGAIPNPHPSIFFRGIRLREFNFAWVFIPQSSNDSNTLETIIKKIKSAMLPKFVSGSATSNFLAYPHIVKCHFTPPIFITDKFEFKKCVVKDLTLDYSSKGINAFFKGTQKPVSITMGIHLLELEYFTQEDFDGTNAIGF